MTILSIPYLSSRADLGGLLFFVSQQLGNDLVKDLIGQSSDLVLGFGLDGMFDEDRFVLGHTQGGALGVGGSNKFGCGHICSRNTFFFKGDNVVRTARNAAPSITEGFSVGSSKMSPIVYLLLEFMRM